MVDQLQFVQNLLFGPVRATDTKFRKSMDADLVRVVSEDLDFLFNDWNQDIGDASLRRSSPVLRSLLVEGRLGNVAHHVGREIRIMAPAICKFITEDDVKGVDYYQSGGAKCNGMELGSATAIYRIVPAEERKVIVDRTQKYLGKSYPVKLGTYLKQMSFAIGGIPINREEVIKYVANKLGGAHYDSSRTSATHQNDTSLEQKYLLLDSVRSRITVADKNAIYHELLSIGQRVINSRDVRHLRKHLAHILGLPKVICA